MGPVPASEALSAAPVRSLVGLMSVWSALSRSSFSECGTEVVGSVLAIDASRDAGTEGYVQQEYQSTSWAGIDRASRGECTEHVEERRPQEEVAAERLVATVGQSPPEAKTPILQSQPCGIPRALQTTLHSPLGLVQCPLTCCPPISPRVRRPPHRLSAILHGSLWSDILITRLRQGAARDGFRRPRT